MNRVLQSAALLAWLGTSATASTFVIDDDGGPGVDFTAMQPAIDAASAGDLLRVRAGLYPSFTLSKGLSILCDDGVSFQFANIESVPSGEVAALSNCSSPHVVVWTCQGTVIVQRASSEFLVHDSRDVRFWNVTGAGYVPYYIWFQYPPGVPLAEGAGLVVRGSRVEVVESAMYGFGALEDPDYAVRGFPGILADGLSASVGGLLHLALTSATGGHGGAAAWAQGEGGPGVLIGDDFACQVTIAGGDAAVLQGGPGGLYHGGCGGIGYPGGIPIIASAPQVRYSGVDLVPGIGCGGSGVPIETSDPSYVTTPGYADPTLGVSGSATPGGVLTFEIRGHPRSKAFLNYGKTPIVGPGASGEIGALVDTIRGIKLGAIPVSGSATRAFPIPSHASVGSLFIFQGVVVLPNGEMRRTNSIPVIVR